MPSTQQPTKLQIPKPHPAQLKIIQESSRFNVVCCGRRWGKSFLGINRVIEPLLSGYPVAWFSPTYKVLSDTYRQIRDILAPLKPSANKTESRIELYNQGSIEFWTLEDRDAGRSRKYKLVIIDEAASCPNLQDQWNAAIYPTLTDCKGSAWFLSTPKGVNFFEELYKRGQDPLKPLWQSWQMPTSTNPFIHPSEIQTAKEELPQRSFNQEYLATFENDEGAVFRNLDRVTTAIPQSEGIQGHQYIFGVDLAKSYDFTVISVIDKTTQQLVYLDRFNQLDYTIQASRLMALNDKFKPSQIVVEKNNVGDIICESLMREGLPIKPFTTSGYSKPILIEGLSLAFEQEKLAIIEHPVLKHELLAFQAKKTPTGYTKYEAPEGSHDDCVISLALAWHGAKPDQKNYKLLKMIEKIDRRMIGI